MGIRLIFDPLEHVPMRVACFMSGSGTNTRKIIEQSTRAREYKVVLIFTDVRDDRLTNSREKRCRAKDIAEEYSIAYECVDIRDFYLNRGHRTRRDLSIRPEFDRMVLEKVEPYDIDVIANAGYMSIMTEPILERYSGKILNVHPADLSIMEGEERKFVGIHVVEEAILAGEQELRATTHVVRERVDYGEILVRSGSIHVELPDGVFLKILMQDKELLKRIVSEHQDRLKEHGDWIIYPLTLQMVAEGRFALDGKGNTYLDGKLAPKGFSL